jgi:trimeric autotransporter adhesin
LVSCLSSTLPVNVTATVGLLTAQQPVLVSNSPLVSIAITANPSATCVPTGMIHFTATGTYADNSTSDVTADALWASGNILNLLEVGPVGTCVAQGTTNVSATVGAVTGQLTVTVNPTPTVVSVSVTPNPASCSVSSATQFTATALLSDNTMQDVSTLAVWSSSNPLAATAPSRVAFCLTNGTATITANYMGQSGSSVLTVGQGTPTSLVITPMAPVSVVTGQTLQLTATENFASGPSLNVTTSATWSTSLGCIVSSPGSSVSTHGGLFTAGPVGSCAVAASLGSLFASVNITVVTAAPPPTVTSVVVTPNPAVCAAGSPILLTAIAHFSDGTMQDVSGSTNTLWSASNLSVAATDGPTLFCGVAGTTTFSAQYNGISNSATGTATVLVGAPTSVTITPASPSVLPNGTQQLTATATYGVGGAVDATNAATWSINILTCPPLSSVSITGLFRGGISVGNCPVTASLAGTTGNDVVSVVSLLPTVTSVTVSPGPAAACNLLGIINFTAMANFSNGTSQDVTSQATWLSSSILNVTELGPLATCVLDGTSSITATYNNVIGSTTVLVGPPTTLTVTPASPSLATGATQQLTATATYGAASIDATSAVAWSNFVFCPDENTGSVSSTGLFTAGGSSGSCLVTAMLAGVSATDNITITAPLISISITPFPASVPQGGSQQFIATGQFSDGTMSNITSSVTWSIPTTGPIICSTGDVASVTAGGLFSFSNTSSLGGICPLTATKGGISATIFVDIAAPMLVSIAVTPNPASTPLLGTSVQLTATGTLSNGATVPLPTATWAVGTCSTGLVGNITQGGLFSFPNLSLLGTCNVTAVSQGVTGTDTVTDILGL